MSDINTYGYVGNEPINRKDPSGLVQVTQGAQRLGDDWLGGGNYSLAYGHAYTSGKCLGCPGDWHIQLKLVYMHGFYCTGASNCRIEATHANIASAYVARAAQEFAPAEKLTYADKALCDAMAASFARDLRDYIMNPDGWPQSVRRSYNAAQRSYEDTHHEGLCAWMPNGVCQD